MATSKFQSVSTANADEFVQFKLETKKGVKESEVDANV